MQVGAPGVACSGAMADTAALELGVRGYEMDSTGRLPLGGMARLLEHARWDAIFSDALGIQRHFTHGVVRAQRIAMLAAVSYPDALRVETWLGRVGRTSFDFVHRVVRLSDDRTVATGTTVAVLLGPNGPAECPPEMRELVRAEPGPDVPAPPAEAPAGAMEHPVVPRWSDQDVLGHVNQSRYLDWLEDARAALDLQGPRERAARSASIQYDGEARAGEPLVLRAWPIGTDAVGYELRADDGTVRTRARLDLA